jgi:hypothetical protein
MTAKKAKKTSKKRCIAWHFVGETLRDGRPVPKDGEWLVHDGKCVICESGLHASRDPFDALKYAPGNTLCKVVCEDIADEQKDKLVCHRRKIVKRINAGTLLRRFACDMALSVAHLWDMPQVVREYLETIDETKRAAAWDAAWAAAWDAAGAAAGAAARAAARAAAWDAAGAAAKSRFNALVVDAFK